MARIGNLLPKKNRSVQKNHQSESELQYFFVKLVLTINILILFKTPQNLKIVPFKTDNLIDLSSPKHNTPLLP